MPQLDQGKEVADQVEVLLVEDNKQDAELIIRALRQLDLADRLFQVRDGAEALDFIFPRTPTEGRTVRAPKVVLLDLKLPKVDGLEVLRRLKSDERTRSIPVVVLTSSTGPQDIQQSYRLGVNSYVTKPVQYEEFFASISALALYWLRKNTPPLTPG